MKKRLIILALILILIIPQTNLAASKSKQEDNFEVELREGPIRDQNIFVPTKNGVQRATYEEALTIEELEKKSLDQLTSAYLLGDYDTGTILEAKDIDTVRAMASTSKLVSIYLVFDAIKAGKISLEDKVTMDAASAAIKGSNFDAKAGEVYTVKELIEAALVVSANDAINALAIHVAGNVDNFVQMMNEKCQALGLKNAIMINPHGLTKYAGEEEALYNRMSAREIFELARHLIKDYPQILDYTSMACINRPDRDYIGYSTNPALGIIEGVDGLKTGYTNAAGRCMIATGINKNSKSPMRIIGITLGCKNDWARYVAVKKIVEKGFKEYVLEDMADPKKALKEIEIPDGRPQKIGAYPDRAVKIIKRADDKVEVSYKIDENLTYPIKRGQSLGKAIYYKNGKEIQVVDLIAKEEVKEPFLLQKIQILIRNIFRDIKNDKKETQEKEVLEK